MEFEKITPDQYTYELPKDRIAKFPLEDRAAAKLLHYNQGSVKHRIFKEIDEVMPANSTLFFNDTRVIPARLIFLKGTGAKIEIFLLDPAAPSTDVEHTMSASTKCSWHCMIGNSKKWRTGQVLRMELESGLVLSATRDNTTVHFEWHSDHSFSEILDKAGKIPLPPYIDREPMELDTPRYQTVYSKHEGAVAAPTAGLHFTPQVIARINARFKIDYLTLHVSAGTFQPIKSSVLEHPMHKEQVVISKENIQNLLDSEKTIAVGTTSMRTLESLYWYGVQLISGKEDFKVSKLAPYELQQDIPLAQSLQAVYEYMEKKNLYRMLGYTEIFIFPGYRFRVCQGLITNFHLPGTTLMMLIAAFVGEDWKKIYNEALANDYRFLSYGDSSLLIPST